jgi:flavin-dependent dehydrogenase
MSNSSLPKVVVIGAGIGGLTAGALLAKRDMKSRYSIEPSFPVVVHLHSNGKVLPLMSELLR